MVKLIIRMPKTQKDAGTILEVSACMYTRTFNSFQKYNVFGCGAFNGRSCHDSAVQCFDDYAIYIERLFSPPSEKGLKRE